MKETNDQIFALDIGTRTVIGLILEKAETGYKIIDSEVIEHKERAMLDGQIHDVTQVTNIVKEIKKNLEERLGYSLKKVSIAAAGRSLKTVTTEYEIEHKKKRYIEKDDVRKMEYAGIQLAQKDLAQNDPTNSAGEYHFVGYNVIEYLLDGIFLKDLIGQKGRTSKVRLIATFLPQVVIDSLLSVIQRSNLEVEHLTLEPIAAANMVIPKEMYNFNLALVDIGAGTSDIAITRGGAMVGYAMVPVAGDEISESIAENYMLKYSFAERAKRNLQKNDIFKTKNILGSEIEIECKEALEVIRPQLNKMVDLIREKIIEINQSPPQAVICIGGGSLTPFLKDELARILDLSPERIGIRDGSDLDQVQGNIKDIDGTQSLTPIGIAVTADQTTSKAVFVDIVVDDQNIQVFSLHRPTVSDALLTAEIDIEKLNPRPGMGLTCTVNGELKTVKGTMGSSGEVLLNGETAELEETISSGDIIEFKPGKPGCDAVAEVGDLLPDKIVEGYEVIVNDSKIDIKPDIYQNGKLVSPERALKDGAEISYNEINTLGEAAAHLLEISPETITTDKKIIYLNGQKKLISEGDYLVKIGNKPADLSIPVEDGLRFDIIENKSSPETIKDLLEMEEKFEQKEKIELVFNGSSLKIPAENRIIKCNGKKVAYEYELEDEDRIKIKLNSMTVDQVFEYINYNISKSMKRNMELSINGESAEYEDLVSSGDNIQIKF